MARLSLVMSCSHSPFLYTDPGIWNQIRAKRPLRKDVPHDSEEANREKFDRCQKGFGVLKAKIEEAQPDVLIIFGDDQKELFDYDNMPALGIFTGQEFEGYRTVASSTPSIPGAPKQAKPKTPEHWTTVKGHPELASQLLTGLMDRGFDMSFSENLPKTERGMGHAFMRPPHYLTPKYDIPVVPIFVNCYYPPQPLARRCYQLGKAVRELIEESPLDLKVAVLGSGGLWHTPMAKDAYLNEEFDRVTLDAIESGEALRMADHFDKGTPERLTVGGTGETRNWICAAAVADGKPGKVVDYVPIYASPCGASFAYWDRL